MIQMLITIGWAFVIFLQLSSSSQNDKKINVLAIVLGVLGIIFATTNNSIIINTMITTFWVTRYLYTR